MTHWIVREWINAVMLALFLCLAWRFWRVRVTSPVTAPRRAAATALFVLSVGECIRSGWAWLALASKNKGWPIFPFVQSSYLIGVIAASVMLVGAVCCLRVFEGTHQSGAIAFMIAVLFLTITIII